MSWADSLGNLATLDRWRAAIGLTYDAERLDAPVKRLSPGPLVVRPGATMTDAEIADQLHISKRTVTTHLGQIRARPNLARRAEAAAMTYGEIAGVGKPLSRLVLGVDNQAAMPHAAVMFDDFVERGGTVFDTAYTYMGGLSEQLLGRWVEDRGVRESVVILDKGGHTPYCDPESVRRQFAESLDRLRTDYVDIYMLHRDNTGIPVGEFVDLLNEQRDAGRLRVYGVSNWSIERIEAANAYAAANGRAGIGAVSNNLSLARMVDAPWAGCVSSSGAEWRAWLERTQTPLMPWSSQARGFFTGRAAPDRHDDPELVRSWYSDDNFARLGRVERMAVERHVSPIVIALAWVLSQPFPTFPLIGPRTLSETDSSMQALTVPLTPEEVAWLNLDA
jgi:aryl-alcohol dehydrogenase-like predicted oxidoreductase